jgi:hypothetical protein
MKFVVHVTDTCGFRRCGLDGGVENVGLPFRVGVSENGQSENQ